MMRSDRRAGTPQVFVVEDNADDEALTVRALKKLIPALEFQIARDGQQAVDFIQSNREFSPDVILLDIKLPKVNGIEVLKFLRNTDSTRTIPTVMLTSSDEPSDVVSSYEAGASGFVKKPVGYEEYVGAVQTLGNFWLKVNMRPPRTFQAG
jgi:CheY-like chemotaxis protein